MSHIWTFSPSSETLLQRCLEAAAIQEVENDWSRKFGRKKLTSPAKSDTPEEKTITKIVENLPVPTEDEKTEDLMNHDEFLNSIDNEINLDLIVEECYKNPDLYLKMAERLSTNTVEKLFNFVFDSNDVKKDFLTELFSKFLPLHIKHQYSWFCVEILSKTNEKYPEIFQKLLEILLEDLEVPNQLLNNYISTVNEKNVSIFMDHISNLEMASESFVHNILTIFTAYKDCRKTEKVQNCIKVNLLRHAKSCTADRNYGRLFMSYLQNEKLLGNKISKELEECLEIHHSPFKRPCLVLIKELCGT